MSIPTLPNPYAGKHFGNVSIAHEDFTLTGEIAGDVHITDGGRLMCHGHIDGDVYVDQHSEAIFREPISKAVSGTVSGPGVIKTFSRD